VAFSGQQIAKIYEDADEVQHMPPVSDEKPVYDSDPYSLGTGEKSDSQHVNLLISGNSQPLITKYHNTMDHRRLCIIHIGHLIARQRKLGPYLDLWSSRLNRDH
jgi:hypothetical protein